MPDQSADPRLRPVKRLKGKEMFWESYEAIGPKYDHHHCLVCLRKIAAPELPWDMPGREQFESDLLWLCPDCYATPTPNLNPVFYAFTTEYVNKWVCHDCFFEFQPVQKWFTHSEGSPQGPTEEPIFPE